MPENKMPCRRCLLEEAGQLDLHELIKQRIAVIPAEQRADEELYRTRLEKCRSCDSLNSGTCAKCGCYAELRAARADAYCPHEKRFW